MADINWKDTLELAAIRWGDQIFEGIKESVTDGWEEINQANRDQLRLLASFTGQLKARELMGEDIAELSAHVEAQIANLEFINKSIGERAVKAFWIKVLEISGSVLFSLSKKAIGLYV